MDFQTTSEKGDEIVAEKPPAKHPDHARGLPQGFALAPHDALYFRTLTQQPGLMASRGTATRIKPPGKMLPVHPSRGVA